MEFESRNRRRMEIESMQKAINVWEKRRITGKAMPKAQLMQEVESFLKARCNCALATGFGTYIRNTPMRYTYKDGKFIFITEGGYKFKGLSANPQVCIAVYDTNNVSSDTVGVTIEGVANVMEMHQENAKPTDPTRYIITVTPTLIDYLDSSLPARGFYSLQRLTF